MMIDEPELDDHISTCQCTVTAHSAVQIAHDRDWTAERLACLLRTVGHVVRTQFRVTASRGRRAVSVEILKFFSISTMLLEAATWSSTSA
jgi:hypothetical protein